MVQDFFKIAYAALTCDFRRGVELGQGHELGLVHLKSIEQGVA
jgi:hypothetical protein